MGLAEEVNHGNGMLEVLVEEEIKVLGDRELNQIFKIQEELIRSLMTSQIIQPMEANQIPSL